MPTIKQSLYFAEIALASYGQQLALGAGANAQKYRDIGMAESQAAEFDQRWSVLAQADIGDGFSAVLFQDGITGEKVLGVRGTEASHWGIDYLADVVNIALLGTEVGMPQYRSLDAFYEQLVSTGKLGVSEQFSISGHSLGGFLAQAFTAKHDAVVTTAYTYNAPGFAVTPGTATNVGTELLGFFGITDASIPNGKVFNARAVDGFSATSGLGQMIGSVEVFNIEMGGPVANHSIVTLTDSIALQDMLAQLAPAVTRSTTNAIVRAASERHENALESLLDGVRRVVMGPFVAATAIGDRNALHTNMRALTSTDDFQSIAGKVSVDLSNGGLDPRNDFSALASLITLSPVVIAATDASSQGALDTVLQGAWGGTYAAWQADKSMTRADRDAGRETFTDQWITDRSRLLNALMLQNQRNSTTGLALDATVPGDRAYEFHYYGGPLRPGETQPSLQVLFAQSRAGSPLPPQTIWFGDETNNHLDGNDNQLGDHLYGGAGADTVNGMGGADHIEGNGEDDILNGGAGDDTLLGGQGNDVYVLVSGQGNDTIVDADHTGRILLDGQTLNGGDWVSANLWRRGAVSYAYTPGSGGRGTLSIVSASGTATVLDYTRGELGLDLLDPLTPAPTPSPQNVFVGDLAAIDSDPQTDGVQFAYDTLGNLVVGDQPELGRADTLYGGVAADTLRGLGGGDQLSARGGDDEVFGGDGDDRAAGEEGDDRVSGGAGSDVVFGDAGADRLYGADEIALDPALAAGSSGAGSGVRGDWLDGGAGDDTLVGDADNDLLLGGAGDDTIAGGRGNDTIASDDSTHAVQSSWRDERRVERSGDDDSYIFAVGNANVARASAGGADVIEGGAGEDWVDAGAGNDYVNGGDDNDVVFGMGGNDFVLGGAGADVISGDAIDSGEASGVAGALHGNDLLHGGDGDDRMFGNGGADELLGGLGNDRLSGDDNRTHGSHHGNDRLDGGAGEDRLWGDGGDDSLYGGDEDDRLEGDYIALAGAFHGRDLLDGGAGDDELLAFGGDDVLLGGEGDDVLQGDSGASISEQFHGDDVLLAGAGDDTLWGDAGDDHLDGGPGADIVIGGAGNDNLVSDGGDYLAGDVGDDTYYIGPNADGTADAASLSLIDDALGNNRIEFLGAGEPSIEVFSDDGQIVVWGGAAGAVAVSDLTPLNALTVRVPAAGGDAAQMTLEELIATASDGRIRSARITATGVASTAVATTAQTISGTQRADLLEGGSAADTADGYAGDDELQGGEGDDSLRGGIGSDVLVGGRGNDALYGGAPARDDGGIDTFVFNVGDGQDHIDSDGRSDALGGDVIRFAAGVTRESLRITNLAGTGAPQPQLRIEYGAGDTITLSPGAERRLVELRFADGSSISGDAVTGYLRPPTDGDDTLTRGNGPDVLRGGAGNDSLDGGAGDDLLEGGLGNDRLRGGTGHNTYVFTGASGFDSIDPTAGEAATLSFVDAAELHVLPVGADAWIVQPTGASVRLTGFAANAASWPQWTIRTGDGATFSLGALLAEQASQAPSLSGRRDAFLLRQHDQLTALTATPSVQGWTPGANSPKPGVGRFDVQIDAGVGSAEYTNYLTRAAGTYTRSFTTRDPIYETSVAFVYTGIVGLEYSSTGVVPPYSTPIPTRGRGTYYAVHSGYFRDVTEVAGWRTTTVNQSRTEPANTARQAVITGTAGADLVAPVATLPGASPVLFRGVVDAGGGDDQVLLASTYTGDGGDYWFGGYTPNDRAPGLGAWIELGAGDDEATGTDADDVLIGGDGNDRLDGQEGADTYLVSASNTGVDRVSDLLGPFDWGDRSSFDAFLFQEYGGVLGPDRVEFDASVRLQNLSYRWIDRDEDADFDVRVLELLHQGQALVQVDYRIASLQATLSGSSAPNAPMPGVEQFVFADGTVLGLAELLERIPVGGAAPPQIVGASPAVLIDEDQTSDVVSLPELFVDPQGQHLSYDARTTDGAELPPWLTFDVVTGMLRAAPGNAEVGDWIVVVSATNEAGLTTSDQVALTVRNINDAPTLGAGSAAHVPVVEGDTIDYRLPANLFTDIDAGDRLTIAATLADGSALPGWLHFDALTNTLAGVAPIGEPLSLGLQFRATDMGGASVVSSTTLGVALSGPLQVNGGAGNDDLTGRSGNDTIDGDTGADRMQGRRGDDTFIVDDAGDEVIEAVGDGFDDVRSSIDYVLPQHVEQLTLIGGAARATGNALDNLLFGNVQANVLDGAAGSDAMSGGLGDDRYVVDSASDIVSESADAGADTVYASVTHSLAGYVEDLILTGAVAIDATGNDLANVLVGNAGANSMAAGGGNDVLAGGRGNDHLVGDTGDDVYLYHQGEGRDVLSDTSGSDTLRFGAGISIDSLAARNIVVGGETRTLIAMLGADGQETNDGIELVLGSGGASPVERFEFAGGASATLAQLTIGALTRGGGSGNDMVTGDRSDDTVNAGAGNDTAYGRSGHDTLNGGSGLDKLFGEGGNDRLNGGSEADELWGGAGDDSLDGSSGADLLMGGAGNDQLLAGADADRLDGGAGHDTLDGSTGEDELYAGDGDDTLDGGVDADLLAAGAGNDIIRAGSGLDVIVAGTGDDNIVSDLDNDFVDAGAGNDVIATGTGADFVAAGRGNDSIDGGGDQDVFAFNRGDGADTLLMSNWQRDTLSLGGGVRYADLSLRKAGNDLMLDVGHGDSVALKDWYLGPSRRNITTLQVVTGAGGGDYDATSSDRLRNRKVVVFNFEALVNRFDTVRTADPGLSSWPLAGELNSHYSSGSDTQAIGGDLSYRYATSSSYGDLDWRAVRTRMALMNGTTLRTLAASTAVDPWTALQAGISLVPDQTVGLPSPIAPLPAPTPDELAFAALAASPMTRPTWLGATTHQMP